MKERSITINTQPDRPATVNGLRSILDGIASQGGGDLPIVMFYYDDGSESEKTLWTSHFTVGKSGFDGALELQVNK